jgi:hypothetical protein
MKLVIQNAAIMAYRRLSYRPWYAIAEFVDNSIDSYLRGGNKTILDKALRSDGEKLTVEVLFDREQDLLRISDNSIGMSALDLENAMVIGAAPAESAGLSEFGMGMKTAAIWFADVIEIRTKKLGEDHEVRAVIDVKKFIAGEEDLEVHTTAKPESLHYTIVELRSLQRRLGVSGLNKSRQFLGSIYRQYLRKGTVDVIVNGESVEPPASIESDDRFLKRADGTPYVVPIDEFFVGGKKVHGWVGIFGPGFGGRSVAGISLIRRDRTVRGWLDAWRPEEIFGDARNDTLNQRIVGELFVDQFPASHTKDAIDWQGDDEEDLGKAILKIANDYGLIKAARASRKNAGEAGDDVAVAEATAQVEAEMKSSRVQDEIRILDVPRPEMVQESITPLIEAKDRAEEILTFPLTEGRVARLLQARLSVNDPYYAFEIASSGDLTIIVNASHPASELLTTAEALMTHYHHVLLDAVAEWNCWRQSEPLNPGSIREQKDRLYRAIVHAGDDIAGA